MAKKKTARPKRCSSRTPAPAGGVPAAGEPAPPFAAPTTSGTTLKLADLRGKVVVLYFYPKDDTPGCTKEACGFRDGWADLRKAGVEVVGVSPDSVASHRKFAAKFNLPFTLAADENHEIAEAYGVWREKSMYGRTYFGVARTTFVIDRQGRIAKVFEAVKPQDHADEVLAWIRENL